MNCTVCAVRRSRGRGHQLIVYDNINNVTHLILFCSRCLTNSDSLGRRNKMAAPTRAARPVRPTLMHSINFYNKYTLSSKLKTTRTTLVTYKSCDLFTRDGVGIEKIRKLL